MVHVCVCVCAPCSTDLLSGAGDAHSILHCDLGCSVGTRAGVFGEAEVIVGAQVDHVLLHPAGEPKGNGGGG